MTLCQVCGKPTKKSRNKFCSQACCGKSQQRQVKKECPQCSKVFSTKQSHAPRRNFCSKSCQDIFRDRKLTLNCKICLKEFRVKRNRVNPSFCSILCQGINRRGKLLPYMRDPISKAAGIEKSRKANTIYSPENPSTNSNGYPIFYDGRREILMHRFVVEQFMGRPLKKTEVVHHINENISDYRLNNLYIFLSRGEHTKYHFDIKANRVDPIVESNLHKFKIP